MGRVKHQNTMVCNPEIQELPKLEVFIPSNIKPKVLVLNHTKEKCGVYQFGKRVYELASRSNKVDYFYKNIDSRLEYTDVLYGIKPHYIIYNWHWDRMPWLKASDITDNRAMKHYFIYHDGSMMNAYDKYLFFGEFDPQGKDALDKRVLLPRPLFPYSGEYPVNNLPTIGSFGFAFIHKRFPELVTMVNNQFDAAVINIHMTLPYFGDTPGNSIDDIITMCRRNNYRKEVQLNITTDFLDDQQLLTFLAGNDINVFAYSNFPNPGLSSAPDYALSVKRPIAITNNMMFRHIANENIMLENNSIKDVLKKGITPLKQYYDKHSLDNFTSSMEDLFLQKQPVINIVDAVDKSPEVLFINHKIDNCGVYQFCKRLYEQVKTSKKVNYTYKEVGTAVEIKDILDNSPPHIIFNWHRGTMPYLTEQMVINNQAKHYFIFHEEVIRNNYDKYLFFGDYDIGNKKVPLDKSVLLPRPLFTYNGEYPVNKIFTIGSFGFGFWQKGFHVLVNRVNQEFKEAVINLHIPFSYYGDFDKSQTTAVILSCKLMNLNSNIKLNITQNFLTNQEILTFLAGNDINTFFYSESNEGSISGLSSATDYALSVNRSVMTTNCEMFRHFKKRDILAEVNTIMDVYNRGLKPLEEVREKWQPEKLIQQMDEVFHE